MSGQYQFDLSSRSTCVMVIDMQNDFCAPEGFFAGVGADITPCVQIVPHIRQVLTAARDVGVPVVYTRMSTSAETMLPDQHRIKPRRDRSSARTAVCVTGSWGAEVIESLAPADGELIIDKHQYSAFFQTDLEQTLRGLGIDTIVITGVTTSACVDSTLRDAYFRGFDVVVVGDAVASYEPSIHAATLENADLLFGAVSDADYVSSRLRHSEVAA